MFLGLFGRPLGQRLPGTVGNGTQASDAPQRPSGAFANAQQVPLRSLIVVLPAHHAVALDRIAEQVPSDLDMDVVVACAGQPTHQTVTAIHAHLRSAEFFLAPAETTDGDLRALAIARAAGDIVTLVDGVPMSASEADREPARNMPRRDTRRRPLSIIVPVHNGSATLGDTLSAIVASDMPRDTYELIVVDDASSDNSAAIAARHANKVIRLKGGARGAAYARNRGADQACGGILVFIDADIRVRRDTLAHLIATLNKDATVTAVSASSDGTSGDGGVPTQYWDLLQQFGAQTYGGFGIHFEASCGAVRREAFVSSGMYNEWLYNRAGVEDLDLGLRLHKNGHRVLLRRDVSVSHLKPRSLDDVFSQAWRWSSLVTRTLGYGATRSLARSHVVHTLSSAKGMATLAVVAVVVVTALNPRPALVVLSAVSAGALFFLNLRAYRFFARRRGLTFAIAAAPLHIAAQVVTATGRCGGWVLRNAIGSPSPDATTQAFAEVGLEMWPPVPRKQ